MWRPLLGRLQAEAPSATSGDWLAEWSLQRNDSLIAFSSLKAYLLVAVASAVVAAASWLSGVHAVWQLAVLQFVCLLALLWTLSRRAADRDVIAMKSALVRVECHRAGQVSRVDFHPRWVRVEPDLRGGSLVRISGQGRSVEVGGYLPRAARPQLAEEFRWALRHLDD
ncbi:MAG TPA: DUF2244 domain-containing protein [Aquabacterium sp.]|uniref:DUF2244 domain-containing protein n=1 Tax=Aquabacterium sp. TaxID=1872578 RepID=UPI002E313C27|nr:DUF2244 domain-containing protein [Aquabacterium sp.]HEX5355879.1 DUF2244 domain-containing protein [Aquabacterium sp.]